MFNVQNSMFKIQSSKFKIQCSRFIFLGADFTDLFAIAQQLVTDFFLLAPSFCHFER